MRLHVGRSICQGPRLGESSWQFRRAADPARGRDWLSIALTPRVVLDLNRGRDTFEGPKAAGIVQQSLLHLLVRLLKAQALVHVPALIQTASAQGGEGKTPAILLE